MSAATLQVTFRNIDASEAVERKVRERAAELERFFGRIIACHIVIERPKRRRHGDPYRVGIDLTVPGKRIAIRRAPGDDEAHEDVYVAVRDAFDAARRRLEDHARRVRGSVKAHDAPPHGRVASLIAEGDYGFIAASDGSEVYFHRNAVANGGFDKLKVGQAVRFSVPPGGGEKGPQASVVTPIGKHRLPAAD